ncbi:1-acyl-sn-glycerol-3-phosphate acyltransferase [Lentibacillus sp. CBA3610]|uniref:lysophospholipid acyltransferase family protein n=1 Tax=Lentibacillus sp. CBA3610 TaxID=2518176 RepID=UPI00159554D8|nr:lysophospholipid acyltransferase family protein [Lentibacillus sp. CBA3610]QKY71533.1 1-acyl-sn-glycerol-3-phosphate acyltransferase [Lentibacillus sp. CBA3610]
MIRSLKIYLYAGILIISAWFKLLRVKMKLNQSGTSITMDHIFATPKNVSQKIIKKTNSAIHVTGQEKLPDGPVLFIANHQGLFDILALLGHLGKPVGFIAKKEIKKLPVVSNWMKLLHCVFIDRSDRRQSVNAINQGIASLKAGHSIVIFPEGTRGNGSELSTFKSGSLRLATKAKVPIVPVAIDGTYQILEAGKGKVDASTISLTINDPIYPEVYQDKKHGELAEDIQKVVERALRSNGRTSQVETTSETVPLTD